MIIELTHNHILFKKSILISPFSFISLTVKALNFSGLFLEGLIFRSFYYLA